eukprot:6172784-Pleurochrysis_carterae.AAC.2
MILCTGWRANSFVKKNNSRQLKAQVLAQAKGSTLHRRWINTPPADPIPVYERRAGKMAPSRMRGTISLVH